MRQQTYQAPLDPVEFQEELARRTAEEKAKMEEFKAHEEKMKAFQKAKKMGQKPPLPVEVQLTGQASVKNLNPANSVGGKRKTTTLKIEKVGRRGSGMNVGAASQNSKSTTANTNENVPPMEEFQNSDDEQPEHLYPAAPRTNFNIQNETGQRGAKPESNQNRDNELTMIKQKKEKCLELFRNNGDIREMIISRE